MCLVRCGVPLEERIQCHRWCGPRRFCQKRQVCFRRDALGQDLLRAKWSSRTSDQGYAWGLPGSTVYGTSFHETKQEEARQETVGEETGLQTEKTVGVQTPYVISFFLSLKKEEILVFKEVINQCMLCELFLISR